MPVITVSNKGQIIIPADVRRERHIKRGDRFEVKTVENQLVLVPLEKKSLAGLYGSLKPGTSLTQALKNERQNDYGSMDRLGWS